MIVCLLSAAMTLPAGAQAKWNRYGPGTRTQSSAIYDASTNQMFVFAGQHAPTISTLTICGLCKTSSLHLLRRRKIFSG
jgi:hypothetical protein